MERREFLKSTMGAVSGTAIPGSPVQSLQRETEHGPPWFPTYEKTLAAGTVLEMLGIPRSWWFVHKGFHPFSPERVLIIPTCSPDYCFNTPIFASIAERVVENLGTDAPCCEKNILPIVHAAALLTQTYGIPHELEAWSTRMASWLFRFYGSAAHDRCWISPMGWQAFCQTAKTQNGVVDWWLILIPDGIELKDHNAAKTQVLITPVFSECVVPYSPRMFWDFMAKAIGFHWEMGAPGAPDAIDSTWCQVAMMDRVSASLCLNERIARNLVERDVSKNL